jgi:hypothetical protein
VFFFIKITQKIWNIAHLTSYKHGIAVTILLPNEMVCIETTSIYPITEETLPTNPYCSLEDFLMRKLILTVASVCVLSMSTGCAFSSNTPVTGFLFTSAKGATGATANPVGAKSGESCSTSILGIIGIGDGSVASAAKAGGIKKVATVDSDNFAVLGIFAKNCTVVTGELEKPIKGHAENSVSLDVCACDPMYPRRQGGLHLGYESFLSHCISSVFCF